MSFLKQVLVSVLLVAVVVWALAAYVPASHPMLERVGVLERLGVEAEAAVAPQGGAGRGGADRGGGSAVAVIAKAVEVEFANQFRDQGQSVRDAIFEASTVRLRPVMMTMAWTVLGGVPLIFSSGAGAEAREALGWIIVGGLGLATLFTLFLTPVAYLVFARLSRPKAEEEAILVRELGAATGGTPAE